jgi:arabinose-5-phosphate isomerase
MMLALGDAIAVTLQEIKKFDKQDFLEVHPGGKIGQELVSSCKHSG